MVNCQVLDCIHNNRDNEETGLCTLDENKREVDKVGSCTSNKRDPTYLETTLKRNLRERPWLKQNKGRIRYRDNGILIGEINRLIEDAVDSPCGGLLASEIRQGLLDKGIETTPQKIVNLITHRSNHIKTEDIAIGTKWVTMYSMEAEK